jgi:predicted enzyme related to lactoylglutathione lyase
MSKSERSHNSIDYIELPLTNAAGTKRFYADVFGWVFQDWGPDYLGFSGAAVDGGFNGEASPAAEGQGVLLVLYSNDIEATLQAVRTAGGRISKEIFEFPGGRRFHFVDPNGSELAVWTE